VPCLRRRVQCAPALSCCASTAPFLVVPLRRPFMSWCFGWCCSFCSRTARRLRAATPGVPPRGHPKQPSNFPQLIIRTKCKRSPAIATPTRMPPGRRRHGAPPRFTIFPGAAPWWHRGTRHGSPGRDRPRSGRARLMLHATKSRTSRIGRRHPRRPRGGTGWVCTREASSPSWGGVDRVGCAPGRRHPRHPRDPTKCAVEAQAERPP
jgi:hypothetical protein